MNNSIDLVKLSEKIYQKVLQEVTQASAENRIDELLIKYGLNDEIEYSYYDINNSKILVVGDSRVSIDDLIGIAKKYGISSNKLEFELDYTRLHNFDFGKLRNSLTYSDVLVGPLPHKVEGIDGFSSFLAMVDNNPSDFPKVIRLEASNELKITKESFKNGLLNSRLYNDLYN